MTDKIQSEFWIKGLVQGVGFRYFIAQKAEAYGLTGWTRNNPDGTVTAVVEGAADSVDKLQTALNRGLSRSHVEIVKRKDSNYEGKFKGFDIRFY